MTDDIWVLDIRQILAALWHRLWIIIVTALVFGGGAFAWTYYMITPLYQSTTLLYVNNSSFSLGSTSFSITSSELTAAQTLVDTYIVILKTRSTLNEVIEKADLDYSYETFVQMIQATAVNSTEVFSVTVTSADPYEAEKIANTIAEILPEKISDVVDGSDVRIVDYAVVPAHRSSPNYMFYTALGVLMGALLSAAVIIILHMLDTIVRNEDHLSAYKYPVLASIPDMSVALKNQEYYLSDLEVNDSNVNNQ